MKQMGKWAAGILIGLLGSLAIGPQIVRADIISEPRSPFYYEHQEDCRYEDTIYIANGPGGELICYESPESAREVFRLENGESIYTSHVYEAPDGTQWGCAESEGESGWFPLDYTYEKYNSDMFRADFPVEEKEGTLHFEYEGHHTVYYWDYPGGEIIGKGLLTREEIPAFNLTFTDEEGLVWGYVSYLYGWRDFWICLDKPEVVEKELYPEGKPVRDSRVIETANGAEDPIKPNTTVPTSTLLMVLAAVVVVMGGSIGLLLHLKK